MVDPTQEFQTIVERIESFIDVQLARFDHVFEDCQATFEQESASREQMAAFQTEKTGWEHERLRQIEELRQESDQLADAWSQLESEQRRLLSREATLQASASHDLPTSPRSGSQPVIDPLTHLPAARKEAADGQQSRQAAVRQFQQLSREIGKHTRRNN